jgi:hypothetical protein
MVFLGKIKSLVQLQQSLYRDPFFLSADLKISLGFFVGIFAQFP